MPTTIRAPSGCWDDEAAETDVAEMRVPRGRQSFQAHKGRAKSLARYRHEEGALGPFGYKLESHCSGNCRKLLTGTLWWRRRALCALRAEVRMGAPAGLGKGRLWPSSFPQNQGQPPLTTGHSFSPEQQKRAVIRVPCKLAWNPLYTARPRGRRKPETQEPCLGRAVLLRWKLAHVLSEPGKSPSFYIHFHVL